MIAEDGERPGDQETLVRVGPGTPMGTLMRQYWMPAALSSEVEADGPPLRLALLGERLIAFRDSTGRVGVMDHRCPHRGASLFLGRNEAEGLRCIYHGWKFDVAGRCVDMPNVVPEQRFADRVRSRAYHVLERAGLIWVHMGGSDSPPPFPEFEVLNLPPENIRIIILLRECNWLQALEGDIDSSHLGFLHAGALSPEDLEPGHPIIPTIVDRVPRFKVEAAEWGMTAAAHRKAGDDEIAWRITNFLLPFYTQTPNTDIRRFAVLNAWVPMDDTHTMMIKITGGDEEAAHVFAPRLRDGGDIMPGAEPQAYRPNGTGWFERWRALHDESTDWGIDRDAQRRGVSYSGISGINMQDQAINESMGPIVDHDREHLCATDMMVAATRRCLLRAARAFAETGQPPAGAADPMVGWRARAGALQAPAEKSWKQAVADALSEATRWTSSDHSL